MKRALAILCASALSAQSAHIAFDLSILQTGPISRRSVEMFPAAIQTNGNSIATMDSYRFFTSTLGLYTVSNVVAGDYTVVVRGPNTNTIFDIAVPATNALIQAATIISDDLNTTGAATGYSQVQANARFVLRDSGHATNLSVYNDTLTNVFRFTNSLPGYVLKTDGTNVYLAASGAGESTTGSNLSLTNATTFAVFYRLNGSDLEHRTVRAGANMVITNEGTNLVFASTASGSSALETNANQFGASVTLTLKKSPWITNLVTWGPTTNNDATYQGGNILPLAANSYKLGEADNIWQEVHGGVMVSTQFYAYRMIYADHLTASRVAVLNAQKQLTNSGVSTTTLDFLDATSSIQTQFDNLTGSTNALNTRVVNLIAATNSFQTRIGNLEGATNGLNDLVGMTNRFQPAGASLSNITGITFAQGDIIYRDANRLTNLAAGAAGTFLKSSGAGASPIWDTPAGSGDVVGPASSVDNTLARFDGTTGKLLQGSKIYQNDNGQVIFTNIPSGAAQDLFRIYDTNGVALITVRSNGALNVEDNIVASDITADNFVGGTFSGTTISGTSETITGNSSIGGSLSVTGLFTLRGGFSIPPMPGSATIDVTTNQVFYFTTAVNTNITIAGLTSNHVALLVFTQPSGGGQTVSIAGAGELFGVNTNPLARTFVRIDGFGGTTNATPEAPGVYMASYLAKGDILASDGTNFVKVNLGTGKIAMGTNANHVSGVAAVDIPTGGAGGGGASTNENQFGAAGAVITIKTGSLQTNNFFFGSVSNAGSVINVGPVTNLNDVYFEGSIGLVGYTPGRILVINDAGYLSYATATDDEAEYLSGVTSAIQTQLDAKQASDADLTQIAGITDSQGDILFRNANNWTNLAAGTSGQFLKTLGAGADPVWDTAGGSPVFSTNVTAVSTNFHLNVGVAPANDTTFEVELTANSGITISGGEHRQVITIAFLQDTDGNNTVALTNLFSFSEDLPAPLTLSTNGGYEDITRWMYHSTSNKWYHLGAVRGF